MGGTSVAAVPVASVTVVFAEGTGAPPSLSAEESVGMLAGLTASPSSSSSASTSTSSDSSPVSVRPTNSGSSDPQPSTLGPSAPRSTPLSTSSPKTASWFASLGRSKTRSASSASNTTRPGISQRALDERPATTEEKGETDGLPPMMRVTDLFPVEDVAGASNAGLTTEDTGISVSGSVGGTATGVMNTSTDAMPAPTPVVQQERKDDADSAVGLFESPTFTASVLSPSASPLCFSASPR
ncbi:hypothetical protein D9611_012379 [Ephemerocybe angulata]|uniref:Uncharacterized protein n=1 Tax=Ephemerocybe angulata TaxID=980116 RepID=A0A8H5CDV0_9AGAR|nr:hypothetical protein D9611_012379 [Tulosesus angulatus]